MPEFDINKVSLRALKIIRKGYKNNRSNPESREKLQQINDLIERKQRVYTKSKKVYVPPKVLPPKLGWPAFSTKKEDKNVG